MNQQINLFQPIFRKQRKILSFTALIQINVIFLVVLALIYLLGWWTLKQVNLEDSKLAEQHQTNIVRLSELTNKVADWKEKYHSEDKLGKLRAELAAYSYIAQLFGGEFNSSKVGFSVYFNAFSRQVIKGLWLTGFKVSDGGGAIKITGGALAPEMVPQFIGRLSAEPKLMGTSFGVLRLDRKEKNRQWVEFTLSSEEEIEEDAGP